MPVRKSAHLLSVAAPIFTASEWAGWGGVFLALPQRRPGRKAMSLRYGRALIGLGLGVALTGAALAQQPVRVRGQIEKVDRNTLTVKARDGAELTIKVSDNVRVMNFVKVSLADIKPNAE
jgi:hypothetical protein